MIRQHIITTINIPNTTTTATTTAATAAFAVDHALVAFVVRTPLIQGALTLVSYQCIFNGTTTCDGVAENQGAVGLKGAGKDRQTEILTEERERERAVADQWINRTIVMYVQMVM